ncbi:MAG: sulfate adenylyltransferase, partial [Acidobacteriota bacterium]
MTAIFQLEDTADDKARSPGGDVPDLFVTGPGAEALRTVARSLPSWTLTPRQLCDLELLANGAFAPLTGFLDAADYHSVLEHMRLADGALWPMPVTLDVPEDVADGLVPGDRVTLRHPEGTALAVLELSDVYTPDPGREALAVFGTLDRTHPGVEAIFSGHPARFGGRVRALEPAPHRPFADRRLSPAEVRAEARRRGWRRLVAFQTRNPLHRAHVELIRRAAERADAQVLLHPVIGVTRPGDVDAVTRVRCYEAVLDQFEPGQVALALLPLAMRMGGPREALWHALIRRNYGATHFVVGRDHAGPGRGADGQPFYGPYDAQDLVRRHQA